LTESRFATMRARDNKMNELKREVIAKLATISKDAKYKDLVRFLIAQGLMTLLEKEVTLQCRQEDLAIVQAELPKALHNIFESPITVGALCAIVLNIFLPEEFIELEQDDFDPEASILQVMENPDVQAKTGPVTPGIVAQMNR